MAYRNRGHKNAVKSQELVGQLRALIQDVTAMYSKVVNVSYQVAQYAIDNMVTLEDATSDLVGMSNQTTDAAANLMESVIELQTQLTEALADIEDAAAPVAPEEPVV